MTPIHQTVYDKGKGNCFAACVASILEIPIDDVPNFCGDHGEEWWAVAKQFVSSRHGHSLMMLDATMLAPSFVESLGYSIATGKSPRGDFLHSVVYHGLRLVHDPHPSGDGIDGHVTDYVIFIAMDPSKREVRCV